MDQYYIDYSYANIIFGILFFFSYVGFFMAFLFYKHKAEFYYEQLEFERKIKEGEIENADHWREAYYKTLKNIKENKIKYLKIMNNL